MLQLDPTAIVKLVKPLDVCKKTKGSFFSSVINPQNREECISLADEVLNEEIPQLPISKYLLFSQTGNRVIFENLYFRRRTMLLIMLAGELADGKKGKYLKKIMDVLWAILEEETWVVPAHNDSPNNINVPYEFDEVKRLDLFSAATGANVALAYYFLKDSFETVIPQYFNEKILRELDRRIIKPYVSDYPLGWKGLDGWYVNNWNPWITSNCLTVASLAVEDNDMRRLITERACLYLNNYLHFCFEDGACVEGVSYYFASNVTVFDTAQLLYDLTGGEYDLTKEPYIRNLAEYITYMYAGNGAYFTVSDDGRSAKMNPKRELRLFKRIARATDSKRLWSLYNIIQEECDGKPALALYNAYHPYRFIRDLAETADNITGNYETLKDSYLESLQQMVIRDKSFVLFTKAANNHEPHGHDDSGEFLVYYKKRPLFVDPGVEHYTGSTFGTERGKIWTMRSAWHNTPILNGFEQQDGLQGDFNGKYRTTDVKADLENRRISMQLKNLYPEDSGILSAVRTSDFKNGEILIKDDFSFESEGEYTFNLISVYKPETEKGRLTFNVGTDRVYCIFDPEFEVGIEEHRLDDQRIHDTWLQDFLYRITFSKRLKNGSFTLKITE